MEAAAASGLWGSLCSIEVSGQPPHVPAATFVTLDCTCWEVRHRRRELVKGGWYPAVVLKPNSSNKFTKITSSDRKRCPNFNYVLHFKDLDIPFACRGYVAVALSRENYGEAKLWLVTKQSEQ